MTTVEEDEAALEPSQAPRNQGHTSQKRSRSRPPWGVVTLIAVLLVLVIFPVGILIVNAFRSQPLYQAGGHWSTEWWSILTQPGSLNLIANSLEFVLFCILTCFLFALPTTWLLEQTSIREARIWRALVFSSMALSPGIVAFVWVLLAEAPGGALLGIFEKIPPLHILANINIESIPGMGFVGGVALTPTIYTILSPSMSQVGSDVIEASYISGAGVWSTIRHITIPLTRPATAAALLIVALIMLGTLEVPIIVGAAPGLAVFATRIYSAMNQAYGLPNANVAAVFGVVLFVLAMILLTLYYRAQSRTSRFATITGKGGKVARAELGRWQWMARLYLSIVIVVIVVLPVLTLFYASVIPYFTAPTTPGAFSKLSFSAYGATLGNSTFLPMALNTLLVGAAAATLAMALGFLSAWVSSRRGGISGYIVSVLSFLPIGIPTVLIATSIFLTYLYVPLPILGTDWVLIIAYVTAFLAFGFIFMRAAVGQIDVDLEDASTLCGARVWQTFRYVVLPLLFPALLASGIWLFANVIRDMTVAPILGGTNNPVVGSFLWQELQNGHVQSFSVVSLVMAGTLFIIVLAWQYSARGLRS